MQLHASRLRLYQDLPRSARHPRQMCKNVVVTVRAEHIEYLNAPLKHTDKNDRKVLSRTRVADPRRILLLLLVLRVHLVMVTVRA